MRRALTASHVFLWMLLVLSVVVVVSSIVLAVSAPEYDFFYVPFASWFVFLLSGLILILAGSLFYWWRRFHRAQRQLARADQILNLQKESGEGHIPLVECENPLPQPEFSTVIQTLFKDRHNVSYLSVEPLPGGYGGSATVLVRSRNHRDGGFNPCPWVVKLGKGHNVGVEYIKYNNYVRPYLTQKPGLFDYAQWHEWAGIAYDLAQIDPESTLQSFQQFYLEQPADLVSKLIPEIYAPLGKSWYQAGNIEQANLYDEYSLLSRKKDNILEHLAQVVDRNDPYGDNLLAREDGSTDRKPSFCSGMDLPWYDPIALLKQWPSLEWKANIHRSFTHGDLNARNVLLETCAGRPKFVWFIDFSHTGNGLSTEPTDPVKRDSAPDPSRGHTLRDFSRLEADCKFVLTRLRGEDDLKQAVAFEQALLEQGLALGAVPATTSESLSKAWQAIRQIRRLAATYVQDRQDPRLYYFSLLHATLPIIYYHAHQFADGVSECYQKRYALISAGMLSSTVPQASSSTTFNK